MGDLAERHEEAMTVPASAIRGEMPADEVPAPYQAPVQVGALCGRRGHLELHHEVVIVVVEVG